MNFNKQTAEHHCEHELNLFVFEVEDVEKYWEEIEPFIARSVRVSKGTMSVDGVKEMLLRGEGTAFAPLKNNAFTAVVVMRPIFYADYIAVRIVALSGRGLAAALDWMPLVDSYAESLGAIELEAWCRPAMTRLLRRWGWSDKPKFNILTRNVKRTLQ